MFHPSSSSSSSPASSSTNHCSFGYFCDGNIIYLPSYLASYSDLKEVNDLSGSKEMQGHEVSAMGVKASRYSPEERKERIERYRSKRNLRNFQKKITYECRKTLADSRPRVRGRFAKNGETESETDTAESSNGSSYYSHHNATHDGGSNVDAWWQMEAALMMADKEGESYYDEQLWANLVSDFSANI